VESGVDLPARGRQHTGQALAVIPSGGPKGRRRGIAVVPTEGPSTGMIAIPRLRTFGAPLGMTPSSRQRVWNEAVTHRASRRFVIARRDARQQTEVVDEMRLVEISRSGVRSPSTSAAASRARAGGPVAADARADRPLA
jgi:hypothetical protein